MLQRLTSSSTMSSEGCYLSSLSKEGTFYFPVLSKSVNFRTHAGPVIGFFLPRHCGSTTVDDRMVHHSLLHTQFIMNMGAEVIAVSEETYQRLKSPQISTPSKTLYCPSQCPLRTVLRQEFRHIKGNQHYRLCFSVSGLKTNLLGMPAITSLTLATRIDSTETGVGQQIMFHCHYEKKLKLSPKGWKNRHHKQSG